MTGVLEDIMSYHVSSSSPSSPEPQPGSSLIQMPDMPKSLQTLVPGQYSPTTQVSTVPGSQPSPGPGPFKLKALTKNEAMPKAETVSINPINAPAIIFLALSILAGSPPAVIQVKPAYIKITIIITPTKPKNTLINPAINPARLTLPKGPLTDSRVKFWA
ncbi:MAG: hypothetical protein BWY53_00686 [Parcubacteria group bacterium ADurb.Bin326]|nr:MAG: hypothetical protein BWY53_00686 [Parcubacteria group bacterium ADurb.Bin326]